MKSFLSKGLIVFFCAGLSGCEILCQAGSGTCGMSDEQMDRILRPKPYGELWTKPGMTKESWRQDWVDCGGLSNGQFIDDAPPRSPTAVILAASAAAQKKLDTCMQSKGYTFRYTY